MEVIRKGQASLYFICKPKKRKKERKKKRPHLKEIEKKNVTPDFDDHN